MAQCSDERMNRRALYGIAINLLSRYLDDEEEIIHDSGTSENPWAPKGSLLSGIAEALRKAGGTWARDELPVILSPVVRFPWEVGVSGDQFQLSSFQPTEATYVDYPNSTPVHVLKKVAEPEV